MNVSPQAAWELQGKTAVTTQPEIRQYQMIEINDTVRDRWTMCTSRCGTQEKYTLGYAENA